MLRESHDFRSGGSGLPNNRQRYSSRLPDSAKSDLKKRCWSRLSRLMSWMKMTAGLICAM